MYNSLISLLILFPIIGLFFLFFIPEKQTMLIKMVALITSLITFILSLFLWILFDHSTSRFQFTEYVEWLWSYNMYFFFGVDGISLMFILLTTFLIPLCILASWTSIKISVKHYYSYFLLMESLLICVFSSLDLIIFFIFFESILIPMYLIIGFWGSRTRKIKAGYQFFFIYINRFGFNVIGNFHDLF